MRNQADVLQGQRFGESARRSLLLQSQFDANPGNLPPELDIYGDGAGQTGATVPQHGVISGLSAQQTSYNNYDELFSQHTALSADVTAGNQNSRGEQIRAGVGSDTLGVSVAQRQYKTDSSGAFNNLDNRIWQAAVQWRPSDSTRVFVSHQAFKSQHGETRYPADPMNWGEYNQITDNSGVTRLGLRYSLTDNSELRGLISRQQTSQTDNWEWMSDYLPPPYNTTPQQDFTYGTKHNSSAARSAELQYRRSGSGFASQWGISLARSPLYLSSVGSSAITNIAQQIYMDWQQVLTPHWQLEAGLALGRNNKEFGENSTFSTYLQRWLPKLGLVYTPDSATHVRLAAWKSLDNAAAGNASLAPVSLAGIVLNRPGDTYKLVQSVALGADRQIDASWLLDGQTQQRWVDELLSGGNQNMTRYQVGESRLAAHWQPGSHALNVTLAFDDEHIQNDSLTLMPNSIREQHLRSQQLGLRWLPSSQWTANLAWSHNLLAATQQSSDINFNPILLDIQERFNQTDANLNWQFNRTGSLDLGVRNATGRNSQYTETDPLIPRFSKGRLMYARLKLAW